MHSRDGSSAVQHQHAHCCHRALCLHILLLAVSPCILQCGWVLLHKWGLVPLHPGLHLLQTRRDCSMSLLQGLQHIPYQDVLCTLLQAQP